MACGSGVGKVGEERYCLGCGVGYNTSHSGFFGRACVCADTFHKIGYQMFTVHPGSFGKALRPHRDTKTARKVSSYVLDFVRDVPLSYETGRICSVCFERYISAFTLLWLKKKNPHSFVCWCLALISTIMHAQTIWASSCPPDHMTITKLQAGISEAHKGKKAKHEKFGCTHGATNFIATIFYQH